MIDPFPLGPPPAGRLVTTVDEQLIRSPVRRIFEIAAAVEAPVGAIAYAPATPPDAATAARLAPLCQLAAENRRPVVMLAAFERPRGRAAEAQSRRTEVG